MTLMDHVEALLAQLRPEDFTKLPPAQLRRLADRFHIASQWASQAEREAGPQPKAGVLGALANGERQS